MPVRDIKATYSSLTGKFASRKMSRNIAWESALERDLYYLLENDPSVIAFEEQPIEFSYGKSSYTPDCMVELGHFSFIFPYLKPGKNILEVKYREDLYFNWKKHKPKLKQGIKQSKANGWHYKVITEKEIRKELLENVKKIEHHLRRESPNENELKDVILKELQQLGVTTINTLLAACFRGKMNQVMALPVIWRLLGEQRVGTDLHQLIHPKSKVWLMD